MALYRLGYSYDMINLEMELIKFYHRIIIEELQWIDLESNLKFLEKVKDSYSKHVLENGLSDISFDSAGLRSAYIFSNTPCFSSTVAYHFLNMLHANPWLLKRAISRNSLTICCLGGGPGAEVVAIAKALELTLKMFCSTAKPLTVCATIIDIDPGWTEISKKVTQNGWKWIDPSVIKLQLSFKQADLTQPLSEVQELVRSSDLVTMVKFLSAVYGTKSREKISEMLQEIIHHMSENGVLFFVNCSRFSCIKDLSDVITTSSFMALTYGPFYYNDYYLSRPSLQVCYELYSQHYGKVPPTKQCQNHVVAWRKVAMQDESPKCDQPTISAL